MLLYYDSAAAATATRAAVKHCIVINTVPYARDVSSKQKKKKNNATTSDNCEQNVLFGHEDNGCSAVMCVASQDIRCTYTLVSSVNVRTFWKIGNCLHAQVHSILYSRRVISNTWVNITVVKIFKIGGSIDFNNGKKNLQLNVCIFIGFTFLVPRNSFPSSISVKTYARK